MFSLTVIKNQEPAFSSALLGVSVLSSDADFDYNLPSITDSDGPLLNPIVTMATGIPTFISQTSNSVIHISPTSAINTGNLHSLTTNVDLTLSDGVNTIPYSFSVTITFPNSPPSFSTTPLLAHQVKIGNTYTYPLPATTDPEGDLVSITLFSAPSWSSLSTITTTNDLIF